MCKKTQFKRCPSTIDKCMRNAIETLTIIFTHCGFKILACCCGHRKYPMTIVYNIPAIGTFELFSGKLITRKSKFYKRDKEGYYYIPETLEDQK